VADSSFIYHELHNSPFKYFSIDTSRINEFCADEMLSTARLHAEFKDAIHKTQPKIKA